jgi:hypothetical protein
VTGRPRAKAKTDPAPAPITPAPVEVALESRPLSGGPFSTVLVCAGPAGCGAVVGAPDAHRRWHQQHP